MKAEHMHALQDLFRELNRERLAAETAGVKPRADALFRKVQAIEAAMTLAEEHPAKAVPDGIEQLAQRLESLETTDGDCIDAAKLLRAFAAQPAQAVPDEWPAPNNHLHELDVGFWEGWNACRKKMLAAQEVKPRG